MQPESTEATESQHTNPGGEHLPPWLRLRIAAHTLLKPSSRLGTGNVIRLPFGRIVKLDVPANEVAALEYVRANTTIPVPKVLKTYPQQANGRSHIVMTQLPGIELSQALSTMTPDQISSVARSLAGYLAQMRQLSPRDSMVDSSLIGGTATNSPGFDHRLGSHPWGPFRTVADFHTYVRFGEPLQDWAHEPAVMAVHGKPESEYKVVFSHADLAPRNILVDAKAGRITGIIDWEFGGWYPEYWEYTKMHYGGYGRIFDLWFPAIENEEGIQKYEMERRAEEAIWCRAGPFGYD